MSRRSARRRTTRAVLARTVLSLVALACATEEGARHRDDGAAGGVAGAGAAGAGAAGVAGATGGAGGGSAAGGMGSCLYCPAGGCFVNETPGTACARQAGDCSGSCLEFTGRPSYLTPAGCIAPGAEPVVLGCLNPDCPSGLAAYPGCVWELATGVAHHVSSFELMLLLDPRQFRGARIRRSLRASGGRWLEPMDGRSPPKRGTAWLAVTTALRVTFRPRVRPGDELAAPAASSAIKRNSA